MSRQKWIDYCLTMPDVYEDYPFKDHNWTVIRCRNNQKVFAWIFKRDENIWINVKADREWRDFWRSAFSSIVPAYHLNKEHWNSLIMDGSIPDDTVKQLIAESYELVKGKEKKRRTNMTKKKLALEVIERLKREYPDAGCTLDYDEAWKLLVSVRLAAQCTDARVNVVVEKLYEQYPDVNALARADVEEIERIVKPCGLGKSKARDISACMKIINEEYGGKIPKDFDSLLKLPGVGRKSANLIMGDVFGEPAIVTDTHCIRLVNRIGLVDGTKDPKKVEMALWKLVPPEEGSDFCHRLVYHGRDVCTARTKPYCEKCCLKDICEKNGVDALHR